MTAMSVRKNGNKATADDKTRFDQEVLKFKEEEDWEGLRIAAQQWTAARTEDPDGWFNLGFALHRMGRDVEAEAPLRTAQRKSAQGERSVATLYLVLALAGTGRIDEALVIVDAIAADPERRHSSLMLKPQVLVVGKRDDEAEEALLELLKFNSSYASSVERYEPFKSLLKRSKLRRALKEARAAKTHAKDLNRPS